MRTRIKLIMICLFLLSFCSAAQASGKAVPAPVIKGAAANPDRSVTIRWKKVAGATSYAVYYRSSGRRSWIRITSGIKSESFRHQPDASFPLEPGSAYEYTVRAARNGKPGKRSSSFVSVVPYVDGSVAEGWERDGAHICYRVNHKRVSGWKKINGKRYWFDPKTKRLAVNTIAGSGKDLAYVDGTGTEVKDPVIRLAVSFVRKHAGSSQNRLERLKACYRYIVDVCSYRSASDSESIRKMPSYANYMFRTHTGNCYRGAAALTYAAKVLGFETRMGVGGVTAYADHSLSTHGWTEVKLGGKWHICDTSMQRYHADADLFMVPRNKYPYRIRIDDTYELTVQNGKVVWR